MTPGYIHPNTMIHWLKRTYSAQGHLTTTENYQGRRIFPYLRMLGTEDIEIESATVEHYDEILRLLQGIQDELSSQTGNDPLTIQELRLAITNVKRRLEEVKTKADEVGKIWEELRTIMTPWEILELVLKKISREELSDEDAFRAAFQFLRKYRTVNQIHDILVEAGKIKDEPGFAVKAPAGGFCTR